MNDKIARLALSQLSEEEALDLIIETASLIRRETGREATATQEYAISLGRADGHVQNLQWLLQALRDKKFGDKVITTI